MGIYGHIKPYIQVFHCLYILQIHICTFIHFFFKLVYVYMPLYMCTYVYIVVFFLEFESYPTSISHFLHLVQNFHFQPLKVTRLLVVTIKAKKKKIL